MVKLLDYGARWQDLEQSANPFAVVVTAHLQTQSTHRDPEARLEWKLRIVRGLHARGYGREDVQSLFRVIDWMMTLPEGLEERFDSSIEEFEREKGMPYITRIERRGIARGLAEAVLDALMLRFGQVPPAVQEVVESVRDPERLRALHRQALTETSLDEFARRLTEPQADGGS